MLNKANKNISFTAKKYKKQLNPNFYQMKLKTFKFRKKKIDAISKI